MEKFQKEPIPHQISFNIHEGETSCILREWYFRSDQFCFLSILAIYLDKDIIDEHSFLRVSLVFCRHILVLLSLLLPGIHDSKCLHPLVLK